MIPIVKQLKEPENKEVLWLSYINRELVLLIYDNGTWTRVGNTVNDISWEELTTLLSSKQNQSSKNLLTEDKTIIGAINELRFIINNTSLSAYDIAIKNGFHGTEEEWLQSLIGSPGKQGEVGSSGVFYGDNPPEDGSYSVAIYSSGSPSEIITSTDIKRIEVVDEYPEVELTGVLYLKKTI